MNRWSDSRGAPSAGFPRQQPRWGLALIALVVCVFARSIYFDFVGFDDFLHIVNNPYFHPVTIEHLKVFWQSSYRGVYMPVTYSLWGLLAKVGELPTPDEHGIRFNPYLFHAVNVLLHIINVLLVWRILLRLVKQSLPALAGAAIFALHPLQIEAVVWISSTKDVLGAAFLLGAILFYLRFSQCEAENRGKARWWNYALASGCFILGVLSKSTVLVTPLLLLILLMRDDQFRRNALPLLPWFILTLPLSWLTSRHQSDAVLLVWSPWWARP